jgi:hypothetical protein
MAEVVCTYVGLPHVLAVLMGRGAIPAEPLPRYCQANTRDVPEVGLGSAKVA